MLHTVTRTTISKSKSELLVVVVKILKISALYTLNVGQVCGMGIISRQAKGHWVTTRTITCRIKNKEVTQTPPFSCLTLTNQRLPTGLHLSVTWHLVSYDELRDCTPPSHPLPWLTLCRSFLEHTAQTPGLGTFAFT